jgi:hypothetical protein
MYNIVLMFTLIGSLLFFTFSILKDLLYVISSISVSISKIEQSVNEINEMMGLK